VLHVYLGLRLRVILVDFIGRLKPLGILLEKWNALKSAAQITLQEIRNLVGIYISLTINFGQVQLSTTYFQESNESDFLKMGIVLSYQSRFW
jgi:hypothetical protein